jgi:transposase
MQAITTIGLDIAKSAFQVHGVDAEGNVLLRRQLKRRYVLAFFQKLPPCLVGIEACSSLHFWSRELQGTKFVSRDQICGSTRAALCSTSRRRRTPTDKCIQLSAAKCTFFDRRSKGRWL